MSKDYEHEDCYFVYLWFKTPNTHRAGCTCLEEQDRDAAIAKAMKIVEEQERLGYPIFQAELLLRVGRIDPEPVKYKYVQTLG